MELVPWHFVMLGLATGACWATLRFTRQLGKRRGWVFAAVTVIAGVLGSTIGGDLWDMVAVVFFFGIFFALKTQVAEGASPARVEGADKEPGATKSS